MLGIPSTQGEARVFGNKGKAWSGVHGRICHSENVFTFTSTHWFGTKRLDIRLSDGKLCFSRADNSCFCGVYCTLKVIQGIEKLVMAVVYIFRLCQQQTLIRCFFNQHVAKQNLTLFKGRLNCIKVALRNAWHVCPSYRIMM